MSVLSERIRQWLREGEDIALAVDAMEDHIIELGRITKQANDRSARLERGEELTYADRHIAKRDTEYLEDVAPPLLYADLPMELEDA